MTPLLAVRGLTVTYQVDPPVRALDELTLAVARGQCFGVVGESGSGKSTLARVALGLLAPGEAHVEGSLELDGQDLGALDEAGWRAVRWRRMAIALQSTATLNPVVRVGEQIAETLRLHLDATPADAAGGARELLATYGPGAWAAERYPHQLSGGQRRLALLAMALSCDPDLVVLDEPTTGLDPTTRQQVLDLLRHERDAGRALLVLTHDVELVRAVADRVAVLYRGTLAEVGGAAAVVDDPRHPYAWALLNARPTLASIKDLRPIRGDPPDPTTPVAGCAFAERCTQAIDACTQQRPELIAPEGEDGDRRVACIRGGLVPVVHVRGVAKTFRIRHGLVDREDVAAVVDADLTVREGEVVGVVGANGAGKSTLAHMLVGLLPADAGHIHLGDLQVTGASKSQLRTIRRHAQLLFQDPFEALSPRLSVHDAIREPLDAQQVGAPSERDEAVRRMLAEVRLTPPEAYAARRTHELSGGQLQRVAIARALVLDPKLLVADEPLSGLDPSEQARIAQLLKGLQVERGLAMVLVSHDLAVVLRVADRVLVMDGGRIVEAATSTELLLSPTQATTRDLLAAAGRDPTRWPDGAGPAPAAPDPRASDPSDPTDSISQEAPR